MPQPHLFSLTVRHYECDAHGWVHPAAMLGYMQEAAFSGSASVGYSARRYEQLGIYWLAYETELTVLKRITYGDSLVLHTWVHDMRRVRSLRKYEIYSEGHIVAHGSTDWVLIDIAKQYPMTIPPEMVVAYSQGDDVSEAPPRAPFGKISAPPAHAFTVQRRVEVRDIDTANHVNNAVYLHYAADAEQQALESAGWDAARFAQHNVALITTHHEVTYKVAAVLGDYLNVTTWADSLTEEGGVRYTLIKRAHDDKLVTQIRSVFAWADTRTGESLPMPADFTAGA